MLAGVCGVGCVGVELPACSKQGSHQQAFWLGSLSRFQSGIPGLCRKPLHLPEHSKMHIRSLDMNPGALLGIPVNCLKSVPESAGPTSTHLHLTLGTFIWADKLDQTL